MFNQLIPICVDMLCAFAAFIFKLYLSPEAFNHACCCSRSLQVLDYLEKRLLSGSSSSSSPEQHMARLQEESRVSLEVLRKTISSLSNSSSRDAKDKDKQELPLELQLCKQQLGDTNVSGLARSVVVRFTMQASLACFVGSHSSKDSLLQRCVHGDLQQGGGCAASAYIAAVPPMLILFCVCVHLLPAVPAAERQPVEAAAAAAA
jgi:hypothetical protein